MFSTDFPLAVGTNALSILDECLHWIKDSPHTDFSESELVKSVKLSPFKIANQTESITFDLVEDGEVHIHNLTYAKSDSKHVWISSISFLTIPATGEAWVNVKATCSSKIATDSIPDVKKPLIIIRLIDRYGGGKDDILTVNHEFLALDDSEADLDLAAKIVTGRVQNRLPVVYVTKFHTGYCSVILDRLSRKLCGLAHVVCEPNREFSNKLRHRANSQNVYGGAVGVYWPDDAGIRVFRKGSDTHPKKFEEDIFAVVSESISSRLPLRKCSLEALQEAQNRLVIEKLRSENSSDLDAYINAFDKEVAAKDAEIFDLKREVNRLQAVSRVIRSNNPVQGGVLINTGTEEDYYENEILGVILNAVRDHRAMVHSDSRRLDILEAIYAQRPTSEPGSHLAEQIKESLRGYRSMNAKVKSALQDVGFTITEDGKHYKLLYREDERYVFALPKSGSDNRGGLNSAFDIINLFF